ncbi:polyprenyl synthetase family protein [Flavobacterium sp. LAR06]|uniref:polyprenyl synthetase family protein n=1 Tax=Flavobacterium sp. LAR06 TaxID=3064897 RepID=UPI0035C046AB
MHTITQYELFFLSYLKKRNIKKEPKNLYEPIEYVLELGGKRIRPILTLMVSEVFGINYEMALPAAMAVEVFHNFSLVHDDIMDNAPLRRGEKTVHTKWNINTGIISGDAMLIMAYQYFEEYEPEVFRDLAILFSKTALKVCEGQQWDIDFEVRNNVAIPEYLKMIEYKTAVLIAFAMKVGAIVAKASEKDIDLIYDFGLNLGLAFQLLDDYLDAFGNPETFGKQVGGDIIENKKTYLYLKALEFLTVEKNIELQNLFNARLEDNLEKIEKVKTFFNESGASKATQEAIEMYTSKAFEILEKMDINKEKKNSLKIFGENLMGRKV